MRVCIIDRAFGSRQIPALAPHLRALGHEVEVIASPWPSGVYGAGFGARGRLSALADRGGAGAIASKLAFALYANFSLRRRGRFDVVHVEEPMAALLLLQPPWRNRPPLVLSTMGPMPPVPVLRSLGPAERDSLVAGSWGVSGLAAQVALRQIRFNLRHAAAVVVNSEALRESLDLAFAPCRALEVIPTGVDTSLFTPGCRAAARQRLGLLADDFIVLSVGGISPRKGQMQLVRALASSKTRLKARLVLVGPGDSGAYAQELRNEARSVGIADRVTLTGAVEHAKLPDHYRAADAFALMSDAEGMPESLLEAMASGLPCIASDLPNNKEAAPTGDEASFVNREDVSRLADALVALAHDSSMREHRGARAATMVRETFAWEKLAPRFVRVYEQVLGR